MGGERGGKVLSQKEGGSSIQSTIGFLVERSSSSSEFLINIKSDFLKIHFKLIGIDFQDKLEQLRMVSFNELNSKLFISARRMCVWPFKVYRRHMTLVIIITKRYMMKGENKLFFKN